MSGGARPKIRWWKLPPAPTDAPACKFKRGDWVSRGKKIAIVRHVCWVPAGWWGNNSSHPLIGGWHLVVRAPHGALKVWGTGRTQHLEGEPPEWAAHERRKFLAAKQAAKKAVAA